MKYIKKLIRKLFNYIGRNNNLLSAKFAALQNRNQIDIADSADLRNCTFRIGGTNNKIVIGDYCSLNGVVFYTNSSNNTIVIGNEVIVNADKHCPIRMNACNGSSITIGDHCLLSNNIEIHTSDYHPIYKGEEKQSTSASVVIGEHSWLGLRSVVLKGVNIAPNTIVGACTVVTSSNSSQYTAIAGNPARVVKEGVRWKFSERE